MSYTEQFAKHFRNMYFGPSFVGADMKTALEGVDWQMATTQIYGRNTIAKLVFHINYYVSAVIKVLRGGPLDAHDKFSYDMPPIRTAEDWQALLDRSWKDAEEFASLVEELPEDKLRDLMADKKYGNWFQNLTGMLEHSNYHMGQISLLKKILMEKSSTQSEN